MKLCDFDGMFDKKLSAYISKNSGKYKEEEWEDLIPKLYDKFGDTVIKSLGTSPRGYYAAMDDGQLVKCLRAHVKGGVPVPEFLCRELEKRPACRAELLAALASREDGLVQYAVNILGADPAAIPVYMRLACMPDADDDFVDLCADFIKENADVVKEQAMENYKKGVRPDLMLEILSRVQVPDERVFDILLKEFRGSDDVQMMAGYLASYGDERALPYLYERIEREDIPYVEFQELKYAIEALGGEYTKQRDFSGDKYYDLIHSGGGSAEDIFSVFSQGAAEGEGPSSGDSAGSFEPDGAEGKDDASGAARSGITFGRGFNFGNGERKN